MPIEDRFGRLIQRSSEHKNGNVIHKDEIANWHMNGEQLDSGLSAYTWTKTQELVFVPSVGTKD